GALDRQRQRVDQQPRARVTVRAPGAVAIARHEEQQPDVDERNGYDSPALQHTHSEPAQSHVLPIIYDFRRVLAIAGRDLTQRARRAIDRRHLPKAALTCPSYPPTALQWSAALRKR